jgi:redox-sensitive bicupin YhaK (pirin superfamily)
MLTVRRSEDRGHADHGWLNAYHSFSFADYYDPQHLSFGSLRVINEDRVQPGRGFGQHGHRDMEIITYILDGALEHKDSMGNGSVIRPGDVQRMSAGSGVMHSEYNHSQSEMVHLLQIWITPRITGMRPGYEEKHFDAADKRGKLRLIAAPDGRDGAVTIHQDAFVYASLLDPGDALDHTLAAGRKAYVHVARGTVHVNGETLKAGDGAKIAGENRISFTGAKDAEVLLFDLA